MPKDNPFVGGYKVSPVFQALSRRGTAPIQYQNFGRDKFGIKPVADGVNTTRCHHQPECIDLLAAMQGRGGHLVRIGTRAGALNP